MAYSKEYMSGYLDGILLTSQATRKTIEAIMELVGVTEDIKGRVAEELDVFEDHIRRLQESLNG